MKSDRDDRIELAPDDERFVGKLADAYTPEPLTGEERVAFTAALEARLEERRRTRRLVPALVGATVAAAVAWLVVPGVSDPPARPGSGDSFAVSGAVLEPEREPRPWGGELLGADSLLEDALLDVEPDAAGDSLPDDYLAIASVFLDG